MSWLSDGTVARLQDAASRPPLPDDRYTLGALIGRGGMGSVYAARDTLLQRDVAIKVSHAPAAPLDERLDDRLRREARILASLEHPGIVPIHDAGVLDDGRLFYVMKLVQGETLADHARTLTNEGARLAVFERIAETTAFAHSAGVVHRDLTPANVMVGRFGEVLVLDWGVARVLDAHAQSAGDGIRVGTMGFMAPEQARGDGSGIGATADVYALGALLHWLLGPDARQKRLAAIVRRCLAENPADRYPDAGSLAADLARYRQGLAVLAHRETVLERAGRVASKYQTFILLILAYLLMRTLFAVFAR